MRNSCAARSPRPAAPRQHSFRDSVQEQAAAREYKTALLAPLYQAQYGAKTECPDAVSLAKHVNSGMNRVAETTMKLTFTALRLGMSREIVRRPFLIGDAIVCAQFPAEQSMTFEQMQEIETVAEGRVNRLQMAYACGDHSTQTKQRLLEQAREQRKALDDLIKKLEEDLFGGRPVSSLRRS